MAGLALVVLTTGSLVAYRYFFERGVTYGDARLEAMPHTDAPEIGVNTFLHLESDIAAIDRELAALKTAGIGIIRQQFLWEEIEEQAKGDFVNYRNGAPTWARYDAIVAAADAAGIEILARLERPPRWAVSDWDPELPGSQSPPDDLADFGDFVEAVVGRYAGKVRYFQIWNEPNLWGEWGERDPDAAEYAQMLRVAYTRAKAANPEVVIVLAGLAPTTERGPRNLSDTLFLERLYVLGAQVHFDVAASMSYGLFTGPHDVRIGERWTNFPRAVLWREIMVAYGDTDKPIWATEYGWMALPDGWQGEPGIWGDHPAARQSRWTVEGIERAREQWPWMSTIFIWASRWPNETHPDDPTPWFRLMDRDFTARPALVDLTEFTARGPVAGTGIHQDTNPAYSFAGPWPREPSELASLGLWRTTGQAGARMTFRFAGDSVALLTYRGPEMGLARVRIDENDSLPDLVPKDHRGQAVIDLYAPEPEPLARIPLASGLPAGTHLLEITAVGVGSELSRGGEVVVDAAVVWSPRPIWPYALTALSWLLVALGAAAAFLRPLWDRLPGALRQVRVTPGWPGTRIGGVAAGGLFAAGGAAVVLAALPDGSLASPATVVRGVVLVYLVLLAIESPAAVGIATAGTQFFQVLTPRVGPVTFGVPELLLLALAGGWVVRGLYQRRLELHGSRFLYLGLAFLLAAAVAAGFAPYTKFALHSLRTGVLEPLVLFVLLSTYLDRRHGRLLLGSLALGGLVAALIALFDPLFNRVITVGDLPRLRGLYGSPNNLGLVLERALPLAVGIALVTRVGRLRRAWWAAAIVTGAVLVATGSRGAWLATVVGMAMLVAPWWSHLRSRNRLLSLALVAAPAVALAGFLGADRLGALFRAGDQSGATRVWIWDSAWRMIVDRPWTGIGPDNFLYLNAEFVDPAGWREPNLAHPHNLMLDTWLSTGLVGGLALGLIVGLFFLVLHRAYRRPGAGVDGPVLLAAAAAMAAALVHGLVDNFYFLPELAGSFWVLIAYAALHSTERPAGAIDT
ncbi:MAG: O-antigen ligase family protein [Chloroflexota bacterium]|nr:O-antigen ligase family protein [Chloroflexota bacterium]